MKVSKRKIIITAIVILLLLSPFALLLNPVLEKFQQRNDQYHNTLIQKKKNGKDVSEQWSNLQFRQKLIADIYRYTFRERRAIKAYETYLKWFKKSWKMTYYARLKLDTATLCRKLADEHNRYRDYRVKAACHFQEVIDWYEDLGDKYSDIVLEAQRAKNTFDLRRYLNRCE